MARQASALPVLLGVIAYPVDFVLRGEDGEVVYDNRKEPEPMLVGVDAMSSHEFEKKKAGVAVRVGTEISKKMKNGFDEGVFLEHFATKDSDIRADIIGARVAWVRGWSCPEAQVEKHLENGEVVVEILPRLEPKNGAELVAALYDPRIDRIEREAILSDIYAALEDASKLQAGLAKKSVSASGSSHGDSKPTPVTSPSGVAAGAAAIANCPPESPSPTSNGGATTIAPASQTTTSVPGIQASFAAPGAS